MSGMAFVVWITGYRILDQIPYMNKYRFAKNKCDPVPLFLPDPNNSWLPLLLYLLSIHAFHAIFPKPALDEETPSTVRVFIELASGIIAYDFIFFWIHLAMHTFPSISHIHMHYVHHAQTMLTASEVQHHSAVDATLQVLVNIAVQNITLPYFGKKHLLSKLLHNICVTYMLTEIHAGYDGFWSLHNIFPWFYGGAKCHEKHHDSGHTNYQQFFLYLDFLLIYYRKSEASAAMVLNDTIMIIGKAAASVVKWSSLVSLFFLYKCFV